MTAKSTQTKPSIVFCHGIWADGSCFNKLIPTLQAEGHQVSAVQYGLDSQAAGVAADAGLFNQKVDGTPWKSKPSWSIVATKDRTVHPDLERFLAKRMNATTVEVKSSHVAMLSHPQLVIDVIRKAAKAAQGATAT